MTNRFEQFKNAIHEVTDYGHIAALLEWDMQVNMPAGGAEDRSDQISTIQRLIHVKITSPETVKLMEDMREHAKSLDPDSDDARLIKVCLREFDKLTKVPTRWVAEFSKETSQAHMVWEKAKRESNFSIFQSSLQRIVELRREYATFFTPYEHVYDPLLDGFEAGLKTKDVQAIFEKLRPQQVALIKAISQQKQVDDSFLTRPYDESKQWEFGEEVITKFGYDWNRGRQDKAMHPFTTSFGLGDVRITTRFDPTHGASALFSTMHEAGHAIYDQGSDIKYRRTPMSGGASMAIHESQSRMFENLIGRSLPFWKHFYPRFQALFPAELGKVDLMTFYRGINKVEPSLIRVESDEATYNLHIMLRLELEIALMEGSLEVKDLPHAWNDRMQKYLGVTPPDDAHGVLQDVHWSSGYIGYFPTYALGNLVSAQLWEKMQFDIPNLDAQIEKGDFKPLFDWLHSHIHVYGAKFEPQELLLKVTGSKIDPQPYVRYLTTKYSQIYGL
jgi:carboxypeptidase Taq